MSHNSRPPSVNRITPSKDIKENSALSQKEKEDRIRQFREQQEEDRQRRLYELQHATIQAQKYREQLEDERRKKIRELRIKEIERRQAVEERKRMIWEAEQERKEAILKRNLEREARIEARRNAQRNSMSYAFGSSTPRSFDLDLAALGSSRLASQGSIVFSAASTHQLDDKEQDSKKFLKANGLDRKSGDDPMSRSMISLSSSSRVRRKTDLMPVMPRDQISSRSRSPGNHGKRAVSMSRLDQLAQPRRRHVEASKESATGINNLIPVDGPRTTPSSMSKSMHNISNHFLSSHSNKHYSNNNCNVLGNGISKSMTHLAVHSRLAKSQPALSQSSRTVLLPHPAPNKHLSKSMRNSAITTRATRTSRLRTKPFTSECQKRQGSSGMNKTPGSDSERLLLSATSAKDVPSRPRSSMSATSEQSVASSQASVTSVKLRNGPRRQRPISLGAVPSALSLNTNQQQNRKGRSTERKAITPNARHIRAKSFEKSDEMKSQTPVIRKPAASQKSPKVKQITPDIVSPQTDETIQLEIEETQKPENKENTPEITSSPSAVSKPRITSEEEAKAAIAEKRRLAREQAEREAELERQRIEKLRQEEEELRRKEEEEQKRFEEEQMRLAELHRLQEGEKLKKAIEEQEQREKEEKEKQEEELKLRLEREELERKAREEAERQRLELEERLKREEAERAERKRRVEQIMSRTRKVTSEAKESSANSKLSSPEEEEKPLPSSSPETTGGEYPEVKFNDTSSAQSSIQSDVIDSFVPSGITLNGQIVQEEFQNLNPFAEQSFSQGNNLFNGEKTLSNNGKDSSNYLFTSEFSMKESDSGVILTDNSPNRTTKLDSISQSNGYDHQDEDKSFTDSISPEEKSEVSLDVLLDFGTIPSSSLLQSATPQTVPSTEFDQLIDISIDSTNQSEANHVNKSDEVNLSRIPGNPFIAFEDNISRKPDNSLTDLLS